MTRLTAAEVEREIVALDTLGTKALRQRLGELSKAEPPPKVGPGFLKRAIAYRLQELAFGGLKPHTRRLLQRLAAQMHAQRELASVSAASPAPRRRILSPGTRLLREWNGTTEVVEVIADGFVWRDRSYRTLSAVAVAITGTKWSGPKFFGLLPTAAKVTQAPRPLTVAV
jgi:hypothetical protein